jgi:hypothetical protein
MAARHHETVAKLLADSYARHDSGLSVSVPVGKPNPAPPNNAPPNPAPHNNAPPNPQNTVK